MNIKTFVLNPLQENCYVVSDDKGEAAVIDCGTFYREERQAVADYLKAGGLTLRHVLCTHGHFDHVWGVGALYDEFGVKPRLHPADEPIYRNADKTVSELLGGFGRAQGDAGGRTLGYAPTEALADGETVSVGDIALKVLHTPGHSPGSVLFYCESERVVFAGDTLFRMSVGRTDLEGGSWQQLMHSLATVVAPLPADVKVYTGHGPATCIGDEQRYNPYFF